MGFPTNELVDGRIYQKAPIVFVSANNEDIFKFGGMSVATIINTVDAPYSSRHIV